MARGEKRRGGHGIPCNGEAMGAFLLPWAPPGYPERDRMSERCHASGAAVDVCGDAPIWAQRAECAADSGVVDVAPALSMSPRAARITAQRSARFDPYNTRNCLPPKKLRREIQ